MGMAYLIACADEAGVIKTSLGLRYGRRDEAQCQGSEERTKPVTRLALPYATDPARAPRRLVAEAPSAARTEFERDRDRIVHSTAFRRLAHKTQVFVDHDGNHLRTRLTHTIEVAQIARALARALRLDGDLAEAVALGHDLGHPPFGRTGEDALDACMAQHGGFDHNGPWPAHRHRARASLRRL